MIKVPQSEFSSLIFKDFKESWSLLSVYDTEQSNAMTISYGLLGTLWGKSVAVVFVREARFTFHLMEKNSTFTLAFFDEEYREDLRYFGTKSGYNMDKFANSNLTKIFDIDKKVIYPKEAKLILKLKTIYSDTIKESGFWDSEVLNNNYPLRDFHHVYIGEVTEILRSED